MKVLRAAAVALAVSLLVVVGGPGCGPSTYDTIEHCLTPTIGEKGADGGPDPCHCNVPPPNEADSCQCTSNQYVAGLTTTTWAQLTQACLQRVADAEDGGP